MDSNVLSFFAGFRFGIGPKFPVSTSWPRRGPMAAMDREAFAEYLDSSPFHRSSHGQAWSQHGSMVSGLWFLAIDPSQNPKGTSHWLDRGCLPSRMVLQYLP